ncbi:MAG: hypothetical protein AAF449_02405 [Myxococcota bacterium]
MQRPAQVDTIYNRDGITETKTIQRSPAAQDLYENCLFISTDGRPRLYRVMTRRLFRMISNGSGSGPSGIARDLNRWAASWMQVLRLVVGAP